MSPPRVLSSEANIQLVQRAVDTGASYGGREGPLLGEEAAVPGQQRGGRDEPVGE